MNIPGHIKTAGGGRKYGHRFRQLQDTGFDALRGFRVLASDGDAGRIDQVLYWSKAGEPDFIVVGTSRWFFGRKSVLPVGDIEEIDMSGRLVKVSVSRDEIRSAPEFLPLS